jgi:hypothetical protein
LNGNGLLCGYNILEIIQIIRIILVVIHIHREEFREVRHIEVSLGSDHLVRQLVGVNIDMNRKWLSHRGEHSNEQSNANDLYVTL